MAKSVSFSPAQGTLLVRNAKVLFEPSTFDGTQGSRRNIVLGVDEETTNSIQEWEKQIDADRLCSNISQYGLRAKICMDTVRAWDGKTPTQLPGTLKDKTVNAVIVLKGIWLSKKQSGLSLSVTDIEVAETLVESPFI